MNGKAAPEIVYHPERLLHPLKRTNPKGAKDAVLRQQPSDPIRGSSPLRASVCEISPLTTDP